MSSDPDASSRHDEARAVITSSLHAVGNSYNTELQERATILHASAIAIARQEKELKKQTEALAKDSKQWKKLADTTTKQLNEFGDVQNWAEMIEHDLLVVEETLRLVEGRPSDDNISGTG